MAQKLVIDNRSENHRPSVDDLDAITAAIEEQLHTLARAWGEYVWHIYDAAARAGYRVVLLDNPDVAGALGYHDVGPDGRPYARIFCDPIFANGGGWTSGPISVSSVISHEVCEVVGDPGANRWANDADGTVWALELCDAVESYSYAAANGVELSDFLLPAYFNPFGQGPFDAMGLLDRPFQIGQGGYAIRMRDGRIDQVFGAEYPEWRAATKVAGSRTAARRGWQEPPA